MVYTMLLSLAIANRWASGQSAMSDARIAAALRGVFAADSVLIDYAASVLEDQMPQSAEAMIELLAEKIVECEMCISDCDFPL